MLRFGIGRYRRGTDNYPHIEWFHFSDLFSCKSSHYNGQPLISVEHAFHVLCFLIYFKLCKEIDCNFKHYL